MDYYKKNNDGTFEKVGEEFMGWPSNGVWLVENGKSNMISKLENFPKDLPFFPAAHKHVDDCSNYIYKKIQKNNKYTLYDLAKYAAEYYANVLGSKENHPEYFI